MQLLVAGIFRNRKQNWR